MPWCPKCKNEYKAGYTICADCGSELVESLNAIEWKAVYFGEEADLLSMCEFMQANGIANVQVSYAENENIYELLVDSQKIKEVQKLIKVYLTNIAAPQKAAEMKAVELTMSEEEIAKHMEEKKALMKEMMRSPYEDADSKAEEYKSGAAALLLVGVLGIVALVLLNLGLLPISLTGFTKTMITGVMGVMFIIFLIMGISSRMSYTKLKAQAGSDKDTKETIKKYLKDSIVVEEFDKGLVEDDPSMEILYFRRMEKLKAMIFSYDASIDLSFAEYILEEVYSEIFEA